VRRQASLAAALASLAATLALVAVTSARADRLDESWRRGNEAYLHGDYAAAVGAYEELDRRGVVSDDLYFNLGAAYFKKGALGPAIWSFERALTLDPDDEDARYNLDQARKLAARAVHDKLEGEDREAPWIRVVTALAPSTETWLFVLVYVGFFVLLALRARADADSRPGLIACRAQLDRIPFGVVLPDAVAFKDGADVNYRTAFEGHAGLRVRIVDKDQDWLRVRLGNGLEGWVRSQDVGRL
jgi:tetratricopeptide (TPR) repeat protein